MGGSEVMASRVSAATIPKPIADSAPAIAVTYNIC